MHKKIKNPNYRNFLDNGIIETIAEEEIKKAMANASKGRNAKAGRCLIVTLYYTGARPCEALELQAKHVTKKGRHIIIQIPGAKGGLPRKVFLKKNPLTEELFNYAIGLFEEMYLFGPFKMKYKRHVLDRHGNPKVRIETTNKVYYYIKKWFTGVIHESISPYFLRHNRFSKLAENGISLEQIRQMKGARSIESTRHYSHLSTKTAKDIARKNQ